MGLDGGGCSVPESPCPPQAEEGGLIRSLAHPTDGGLWKFMSLLEKFSGAMADATPIVAFAEAYNVGKDNITHTGSGEVTLALMMPSFGNGSVIPADAQQPTQVTGGYGFPVESVAFQELCDPTKRGTISNSTPVRKGGYVPLKYQNLFGQQYGKNDYGPLERYKDDGDVVWAMSFVTGMPFGIYGSLADLSLSTFCGGTPPTLKPIVTRIADLDKARATSGARDFTWTHTNVQTTKKLGALDHICSKPTNSECFDPTNAQDIANQEANLLQTANNTGVDNMEQLQKLEAGQATPPTFADPVDGQSYLSDGPLVTQDRSWPNYPTCDPQIGQDTAQMCRLTRKGFTNVYEQIFRQCEENCPNNNPTVGQQPANPPSPPVYSYHDNRYIFQYATVSKAIDASSLSEGGDPDNYPKPMHFTIGNGNLADNPADLPAAIQRLQFLALAYRSITANPWWTGAKVVAGVSNSRPVFANPNGLGLFTYAQSQVYNPVSWDLYTQSWHAKLVPASLLERNLGSFNSPAIDGVFKLVTPLAKVLNAH